jgi:hypothetical protein
MANTDSCKQGESLGRESFSLCLRFVSLCGSPTFNLDPPVFKTGGKSLKEAVDKLSVPCCILQTPK